MPNLTFDGINENGVAMNCNVAPAVDLDFATLLSTNYGKPRIHAVSVVRYVLDHAKTAAHGVELLKNMDIYGGYGTWGLHWMLSDAKETYIIECIDGELVVSNDTDNIMTNFYVNYGSYSKYSKYMAHLMERVKYTQAYEADTNPFWYTEYTEGNLTIANNPMDFKAMMQFGFDT